jgi:hypothetical protein
MRQRKALKDYAANIGREFQEPVKQAKGLRIGNLLKKLNPFAAA